MGPIGRPRLQRDSQPSAAVACLRQTSSPSSGQELTGPSYGVGNLLASRPRESFSLITHFALCRGRLQESRFCSERWLSRALRGTKPGGGPYLVIPPRQLVGWAADDAEASEQERAFSLRSQPRPNPPFDRARQGYRDLAPSGATSSSAIGPAPSPGNATALRLYRGTPPST